MLTHGVGLECVHAQPGQTDLRLSRSLSVHHRPHKQAGMVKNLYCFKHRANIRAVEPFQPWKLPTWLTPREDVSDHRRFLGARGIRKQRRDRRRHFGDRPGEPPRLVDGRTRIEARWLWLADFIQTALCVAAGPRVR
jgi:hypothetical protein